MKYARFFSIFVAAALAIYGIVGFYFLPLASFEGCLTRMAKLPESQFGWTREQPAINPDLMKSAEWEDADVLAIGDSFTYAQVWQTVFAQRGVHVRTETWGSVFNICGDFADWIRSKGFKGKYVIIESVEMYLENRLARSAKCSHMEYHHLPQIHAKPPVTLPDRHKNDFSGRLSIGIQTRLNVLEYERLSQKPDFSRWDSLGEARMERLPDGCELFSHPSCNDVLFYVEDRVPDLGEGVLANMEKIKARLHDYTTVWAIIPDKSTAYLHPDKKFWDAAERRFHAPNILKVFRRAIREKTVDLYLGNDTHVSTTGYLLLGNTIYQSMYH